MNDVKAAMSSGCYMATADLFTWAEATQLHINQKELMAILFFLQSSPISLRHKVVDIGVDNTTALSYVRKLGGRHKYLAQISDQVFHFLMTHHTVLLAYHLPGEMNTLADHESRKMRKIHSADLKMNHKKFQMLEKIHDPHTMDAFSTRQNRQLKRFASWDPQPGATWTDALAHPWHGENLYCNPPFNMIGRVLQKVESEGTTITLIAPLWPAQT